MEQRRPGIAKAAPLRADLDEETARGGAFVRTVLQELEAMIANESPSEGAAFVWGTPERGGGRLIRPSAPDQADCLRISWSFNEITSIEIETRDELRFEDVEYSIEPAALVDRLIPMVWAHIRRGGDLPVDAVRFARFF